MALRNLNSQVHFVVAILDPFLFAGWMLNSQDLATGLKKHFKARASVGFRLPFS